MPGSIGGSFDLARSALIDISRAIELAMATATLCRAALAAQNADADADVAFALRWSAIDVVSRQTARLRAIADALTQQGRSSAVSYS
jgi:hypothetical protein